MAAFLTHHLFGPNLTRGGSSVFARLRDRAFSLDGRRARILPAGHNLFFSSARSWAHVSLDYQWVKNPGYNTDSGPVSIVAVRVHAQF
jgi:hypothetical protein